MKKLVSLLLALAMIFALAACGSQGSSAPASSSQSSAPASSSQSSAPASSSESSAPASSSTAEPAATTLDHNALYAVGSGAVGGTYNAVGALIANFLNDKGFGQFSATATTGGVQNTLFMQNGTCEFGMVGRACFNDAERGVGSFADFGPNDDLCVVAPLYAAIFQQFVKTGITSFDELKGGNICVGGPGSGDEQFAHTFYEGVLGWEWEVDLKPLYLGSSEAVEAMKDGHADGMVALAQVPFSAMIEVVNADKATVIGVPQEYIDGICDQGELPYAQYVPAVVPAGKFKGIDQDLPSFASPALFGCSKTVDEELVYQVTKYLWENIDELTPLHAALTDMKIEDVKTIADLPIHPGALRYYKEIGIL